MEIPKSDFSKWYNEVLDEAGVIDKRYGVKGCYVWMPFGFKIRTLVVSKLRELMERTGHEEALFPTLIPEPALEKEAEHIRGFEDSVYWVTHGGLTKLDIKLALRPTSETAIYPMFALWIRSHADMPLKLFQIVNTFRYETKHTRPLIRLREITTFKEAHCAFSSLEEAEKQMELINETYSEFWNSLGVPFLMVKRPEWDKFPGADYTIAFDTIMPSGKTLQIATSHNLGTNFSKTFEINFEDESGEQKHPYITCHGISDRAIASLIGIHGDDRGLVLPPEFAPIQIVVVPILFKGREEEVLKLAREVQSKLEGNFRVVLDDSDETAGSKYYKWELKGVPIRIEIGPRDVKEGKVVIVRRDTLEKKPIPLASLEEEVESLVADITDSLKKRARQDFDSKIRIAESKEDLKRLDKEPVVIKARLCQNHDDCGMAVQEMLTKEFRGVLLGERPSGGRPGEKPGEDTGKCVFCGNKAEYWGIWSDAY